MMDRASFYDLTRTTDVVDRGVPRGPAVPMAMRRRRRWWRWIHDEATRREVDSITRWGLVGGLAIAAVWQALRAWL